jgi:DNA-binding CsgD family transcriptional regulator
VLFRSYYNEFLRRHATTDGLDVYLFDGSRNVGDLRLWRAPGRRQLGEREVMLMQMLEPALVRAWSRPKAKPSAQLAASLLGLTGREAEIAQAVAKGQTDKTIAQALGISIWTVRTHLTHLFEKLRVPNRTSLAAHINRA